jgi:hypothetical protein
VRPQPVWTLWSREKFCSSRELNSGRQARSPSLCRLSYLDSLIIFSNEGGEGAVKRSVREADHTSPSSVEVLRVH